MTSPVRYHSGRRRTRAAILGLLLSVFAALGVALAAPASTHAALEDSTPANGATLDAVPATVQFHFSESVSVGLGYLRVVDSGGKRVDTGVVTDVGGDPAKVSVALPSGLPDGGYIASYRVISADSHPVEGAISFVVGAGTPPPIPSGDTGGADGAASTNGAVGAAYPVFRWLDYAGLVVLGGAFVFVWVCWPAGRRLTRVSRLVWGAWGFTAVATTVSLLLQGVYGAGDGLGALFRPALVDATLQTNLGRLFSLRLLLLGLLGLLLWLWTRPRVAPRWIGYAVVVLLAGSVVTFSAAGHSTAGIQVPLALASDATHLGSVGVWIGGVVAALLLALPAAAGDDLTAAMRRFSAMALVCVAIIAITGIYQGWRLVGTFPALTQTTYGYLLLGKVMLFLALVGLGYASRGWVQKRLSRDVEGPSRQMLRQSLLTEVGTAAVVIALTAVLVATPPAREVYAAPAETVLQLADGGSVQLTLDPARTGTNQVHIYVFDAKGGLRDPEQIEVTALNQTRQIGPLPVPLTHAAKGHWIGSGFALPVSGRWTFSVTVTDSEFDTYVADTAVDVR